MNKNAAPGTEIRVSATMNANDGNSSNFDWMNHHLQFDKVCQDGEIKPTVLQEVLDYMNTNGLPRICVLDDSTPEKSGWTFYRFLHLDGTYHCKGHCCDIIQVNDSYHPVMSLSQSYSEGN